MPESILKKSSYGSYGSGMAMYEYEYEYELPTSLKKSSISSVTSSFACSFNERNVTVKVLGYGINLI